MKKIQQSMIFAITLLASNYLHAEGNQTMLGGFDFHGEISSESTNNNLIVTGNFVFPIVNKHKKENPYTNEPAKVIERLKWILNVEKFPISAKKIYCTISNKNTLKNTANINNCLNKKVSVTISNPNISFNEYGLAVSIETDKVNIVPFEIIKKSGRIDNGL